METKPTDLPSTEGTTVTPTTLTWFETSPDPGDPACLCSLCGELIGAGEIPSRITDLKTNMEARFHRACFKTLAAVWQATGALAAADAHPQAAQADSINLGPCCACESTAGVNNILMLKRRGPVPGVGWGCLVCDLPFDGAVAVVCDDCLEANRELRFVCKGRVDGGRVPIGELSEEVFDHNMEFHPEGMEVEEDYSERDLSDEYFDDDDYFPIKEFDDDFDEDDWDDGEEDWRWFDDDDDDDNDDEPGGVIVYGSWDDNEAGNATESD